MVLIFFVSREPCTSTATWCIGETSRIHYDGNARVARSGMQQVMGADENQLSLTWDVASDTEGLGAGAYKLGGRVMWFRGIVSRK